MNALLKDHRGALELFVGGQHTVFPVSNVFATRIHTLTCAEKGDRKPGLAGSDDIEVYVCVRLCVSLVYTFLSSKFY